MECASVDSRARLASPREPSSQLSTIRLGPPSPTGDGHHAHWPGSALISPQLKNHVHLCSPHDVRAEMISGSNLKSEPWRYAAESNTKPNTRNQPCWLGWLGWSSEGPRYLSLPRT